MAEKLKSCIDEFFQNMIKKIDKKELIPVIQQEYNDLMDVYEGLTILTNEEFESLYKTISDFETKEKEMQ